MKNLFKISILAVAICFAAYTGAKAQTVQPGVGATAYFTSATNSSGLDTVNNTGAKTQSLTLAGYWDVVTITCDVTKISGTVAGSIVLQGCDGLTNKYVAIGSAVSPTDATKSYSFSVNPSTYAKYQIVYTGASTMSASVITHVLYRKSISTPRQF